MNYLDIVWFALGTVTPIYLVTALGVVLRRAGALSDGFLRDASRLVFNLGAPAMLFLPSAAPRSSLPARRVFCWSARRW